MSKRLNEIEVNSVQSTELSPNKLMVGINE